MRTITSSADLVLDTRGIEPCLIRLAMNTCVTDVNWCTATSVTATHQQDRSMRMVDPGSLCAVHRDLIDTGSIDPDSWPACRAPPVEGTGYLAHVSVRIDGGRSFLTILIS